MFLLSHQSIPEAKGIFPRIAKLFLWDDNQSIFNKKQIKNKISILNKTLSIKQHSLNNSHNTIRSLRNQNNLLKFALLIFFLTVLWLINLLNSTIKIFNEKLNSIQNQQNIITQAKITKNSTKQKGYKNFYKKIETSKLQDLSPQDEKIETLE